MEIIQFFDNASFTEDVTLDGIPLRIRFDWNERGQFWAMSFLNTEDVKLVSGIKLVLNYPLIGDYVDRGLPKGEMFCNDTTGKKSRISFEDMVSGEVELSYLTEAEIDAF